jgi:hypothetical protein
MKGRKMNKQEIEHKIEQAKKGEAALRTQRELLEAQLAEKTAFAHGACGINEGGQPFVFIYDPDHGEKSKPFYEDGCSDAFGYVEKYPDAYTILIPNIFDDLAAMAEDLEKCEVFGIKMVILSDGDIIIGDQRIISDKFDLFYRSLGRRGRRIE